MSKDLRTQVWSKTLVFYRTMARKESIRVSLKSREIEALIIDGVYMSSGVYFMDLIIRPTTLLYPGMYWHCLYYLML